VKVYTIEQTEEHTWVVARELRRFDRVIVYEATTLAEACDWLKNNA